MSTPRRRSSSPEGPAWLTGASMWREPGRPCGSALGQFLGDFPGLAVFLHKPEVRILLDHYFEVFGDVPRCHREVVWLRAGFFPLSTGQRDALLAVHLPALTSETGRSFGALHRP